MEDAHCRLLWTKEQIMKLIRLYRKYPMLWNPNHKHFRNQFQRELAYGTISFEMGMTKRDVRLKMTNLRTQYQREEKKMRSNDFKQPVWEYFNAMKCFFELDSDVNETEDVIDDKETYLMEVNDDSQSDDENWELTKQPSICKIEPRKTYKWGRTANLKLVETYEKFPELYKRNIPDYRDKHKRKLALENIAQQMGVSSGYVQYKMKYNRAFFNSQVKMMRQNNLSRSTWYLFDAMKFFYDKEYYTPQPKFNTGVEANELEDTCNSIPYEDVEDSSSALVEQEQISVSCGNFEEPNEFTTFGQTVASELRITKDHESIHKLLKQEILKAVEEAKELMKASK